MPTLRALSPAKLNLTFDITGLLADGYHQVETLMQAVDLCDELTFCLAPDNDFHFRLTGSGLAALDSFPLDQTNLIARAARLFQEQVVPEQPFSLAVHVDKKIPLGAGLAGGSSNAAACLLALNQVFGQKVTGCELADLGAQLGADVPFCLSGGTAIGYHRGDVLEPLDSESDLFFCIVKPREISVSTPWAYSQYDCFAGERSRPDLKAAARALSEGDLARAISSFGNVFEPVVFARFPELIALKQALLDLGCWCCHLSGSGPALYAVVPNREMAHHIRRKLMGADCSGYSYLEEEDYLKEAPPLDFFIAQSLPYGVRLIEGTKAQA